MKHTSMKTAALLLALGLANTVAQAQTAAEIEGPINAVVDHADGTGTITVMGIDILIPASATISTPTTTLSLGQLVNTAPLPGRAQPGFIGGTAIIVGTTSAAGLVTAAEVFVEPAENVILGVITSNTPDPLTINNVPIVFLTDARIPAGPALNDLGLEVDPTQLPVGTVASAEGYYDGNNLQTFLMEAEGVAPVDQTPQVGITRVQARIRDGRLEVRGGLTGIAGDQTLELRNADTDALISVVVAQEIPVNNIDVLIAGTAEFRFQLRGLAAIPATIRVVNLTSPSEATAAVDIR